MSNVKQSMMWAPESWIEGLRLPWLVQDGQAWSPFKGAGHAPLVLPDGSLTPQGCGFAAGFVGLLVYLVLYFGSRVVTPLFSKSYKQLSIDDQRSWDTRYASVVHAISCVYFSFKLLAISNLYWVEPEGTGEPGAWDIPPQAIRTSSGTFMALGFSTGYFATDFVTCLMYDMGGPEMLAHHVVSLSSVAYTLYTGEGHMHTLWMLFTEFTTPLIHFRWWLDKMNMKSSKLYFFNGLGIGLSWIFARLAVFPPYFIVLWNMKHQHVYVTKFSKSICATFPAALFFLNLFWFWKIVNGVRSLLRASNEKKEKSK